MTNNPRTANNEPKAIELRNQIIELFEADKAGDKEKVAQFDRKLPEKIINANIQLVNEERVHVKKALDKTNVTNATRESAERYLKVLGNYVQLLMQSLKLLKTEDFAGMEAQQPQAQKFATELQELATSEELKDIISGRMPF